MLISCPKEIKNLEHRIALCPELVESLCALGHKVWIETGAGKELAFTDEHYQRAGAQIVSRQEAFQGELVVKVKEPQEEEYAFLKESSTLFCFLHLAADPQLLAELLARKVTSLAFETVGKSASRYFPILAPMSEIAGRLSVQMGAQAMGIAFQGRGVLLGAVQGTKPARVALIGLGAAGIQALDTALGMGAQVDAFDLSEQALQRAKAYVKEHSSLPAQKRVQWILFDPNVFFTALSKYDLIIFAALSPGQRAPTLLSLADLSHMKQGAVIVDISIDQGGCAESSRPTTLSQASYVEQGVVHVCVSNMPGFCARSSTIALSQALKPYLLTLAEKGIQEAILSTSDLYEGVNTHKGQVAYEPLAKDQGASYVPYKESTHP